jgi:ribosomal protein S27AE
MTTEAFAAKVSPIAQAMKRAYELSTAGTKEGTFPCPKCGSQVRFTALVPHQSRGQCSAAGCIRWSN